MDIPNYIELKPREEILATVHASLLPKLWLYILLSVWTVLPFFFLFPLWRLGAWGIGVFFLWLFSGALWLGRTYFMWSRTLFLITDLRVIDYDQRGFFHHVVTQARYDAIDEVSVQVKGVASTLFRYGTLRLQLQGSAADIVVEPVYQPAHLSDLINDLRTQDRTPHANT
jgi:hypothetical protein